MPSRSTAWGYLTANLALPGMGSFMAGRRITGCVQMALTFLGTGLTLWFGARFITWYLANWTRFQDPEGDPLSTFTELWGHLRWALLGVALFVFALLWGLLSGYLLVSRTQRNQLPPPPAGSP